MCIRDRETIFTGPIEHIEHNQEPIPEKTSAVLAVAKKVERANITKERPRTIMKTCLLDHSETIYSEINNLKQITLN